MKNGVLVKIKENGRKHENIKLVVTERRWNYSVSGPNYHTTKFLAENVLAIEMNKTQILTNKSIYLGLSMLVLIKSVMYELWYHFVKSKFGEKVKPCYMDTDSFNVQVKTNNIYVDIAEDIETWLETSNYELDRPLRKGENKNVIRLRKGKLDGKMIQKFAGLGEKTYSYLIDDGSKEKKQKKQNSASKKEKLNSKIAKSLEANQI